MRTPPKLARHLFILPAIFLVLSAITAWAQDSTLELGQPQILSGQVVVDVRLQGLFNHDSRVSLKSGVPATLVFKWTIRRKRDGWHDPEVATGELRNRVFFDVLEEQYFLFNHQGRPLGACAALAGVTEALCHRDGMVLTGGDELAPDVPYYVEMVVTLKILNDQQVRGFETWLWGEGGSPVGLSEPGSTTELETREQGLGLDSGLSDIALGLIMKIAGLVDQKVTGVSPVFFNGEKQE